VHSRELKALPEQLPQWGQLQPRHPQAKPQHRPRRLPSRLPLVPWRWRSPLLEAPPRARVQPGSPAGARPGRPAGPLPPAAAEFRKTQ
jgi:hypothetical protein